MKSEKAKLNFANNIICVRGNGMFDLLKRIYYLLKLHLRENQHNVT